jgi:hypothetical protein
MVFLTCNASCKIPEKNKYKHPELARKKPWDYPLPFCSLLWIFSCKNVILTLSGKLLNFDTAGVIQF